MTNDVFWARRIRHQTAGGQDRERDKGEGRESARGERESNLMQSITYINCKISGAELQHVKHFAQIKSFKPNFTQTKARKLRQI